MPVVLRPEIASGKSVIFRVIAATSAGDGQGATQAPNLVHGNLHVSYWREPGDSTSWSVARRSVFGLDGQGGAAGGVPGGDERGGRLPRRRASRTLLPHFAGFGCRLHPMRW